MEQIDIDLGIYDFLSKVLSGFSFEDYFYSPSEIQYAYLVEEYGYAKDFKIESDIIPPNTKVFFILRTIAEKPITLTKKGSEFVKNFNNKGASHMNYEEEQKNIRLILQKLYDEGKISFADFHSFKIEDYRKMLIICDEEGYISNLSISKYKDGSAVFENNARITPQGVKFLKNENESNQTFTQHITIEGSVNSAVFGNNNTVTNNFNESLEKLEQFISAMSPEDQSTANEILDTIKTQEVKPGMFKRFVGFFEKHPKFVNALGQSAVWLLTNSDKIPFI